MIVLFTDFGLSGPYTGQVKAVLHRAAPDVAVIDLFADAPSRNPRAAAYLLAAYCEAFPAGSVFLAVVDPGVGGPRRPVVVDAGGRWFVGPDNGLMEIVRRRAGPQVRCWPITDRPERLSSSFHGRDLFAPVAARLARGVLPAGPPAATGLTACPEWPDDLAEITYVDAYGNAMTGLRSGLIPRTARVRAGGRDLTNAEFYSSRERGDAFWYENGNGLVEIAVNLGNAAVTLGLDIGSPVDVLTSPAPATADDH